MKTRWRIIRKPHFAISSLVLVVLTQAIANSQTKSSIPVVLEVQLKFTDADRDVAEELRPILTAGRQQVETFFDKPFSKPFEVEIHPDRAAFDAYFHVRWNAPKTEAWMVASGVSDRLTILSPRVWKTEAVEHDPENAEHVRDLLVHELVHVYHGQHNPRPDFDGMDEAGWLVEGMAVFVSGQLEHEHRQVAREAIQAGTSPTELANVWSGRHRYGVAGSLVEYIHSKHGKDKLKQLLAVTTNAEALKLLGTTEPELLAAWKSHVTAQQ